MFLPPKLLKLLFSLTILCMGKGVASQAKNNFESISTAQGLSQGMVFDMLQSND